MACVQARRYARAVAHFSAAIRLDPTLAYAHVGRVNAYGAIGAFTWVIAEYTETLCSEPHDAFAYAARATAYNGMGRFDQSIPDATEAIRLAPQMFLGYDARGYGYMQRGNFNIGIKLLAITWMLATFGFLRRNRFDWRTPTGTRADLEHAVKDFTEAIRLNPQAWDCYHGRARIYQALGELEKAAADQARAAAGPRVR
jgi:tetratricopeptide (TPR) repeat protein